MSNLKNVPAAACEFQGEVTIDTERNGPDAKTAPFKMLARTSQPIDHPWWGKVAHDLSGMMLPPGRSKIGIDFNHNADEVIGYANKFNITEAGLELSGALVPYKDSDRASEILFKAREGVPWESSISFGGSGIEVEEVADGATSPVNGYDFEGPGVIIRKWPLRSCAICLSGADQGTSTTFADDGDRILVTMIEGGQAMATTELTEAVAEAHVVDDEVTTEATEVTNEETQPTDEAEAVESEAVDNDTDEAADEPVAAVESEMSARAAEGAKFIDAFGAEGAMYFAQGMEFVDAMQKHVQTQADKIQELQTRLQAVQPGGEEAVSFSVPEAEQKKKVPLVPSITNQ